MTAQLARPFPVRYRARRTDGVGVPNIPGLDGLRAVAVLAVLAYHADLGWAGGGFLGVEIFFTLSGFLITHLLVAELRRYGRVDGGAFVRARARRLLPALVACVIATVAVQRIVDPESVADLRGDALASLSYLQNWHLVLAGIPYSESFSAPSPFLHLWSLSIEGQLYLVWPLLYVGVIAFCHRWTRVGLTAALAIASAVSLAAQYDPDGGGLAYYATDARCSGFLAGAALALAWRPDTWLRPRRPAWRIALNGAGLLALTALLVDVVVVSEFDGDLYRHGGLLRTGVLTVVVIAAVGRSPGPVSRLLGARPLVAVGKRSYGLYLYHWPVIVLFRDLPSSTAVRDVLALSTTVVVTEVSYRFLEAPIRRGGLRVVGARLRMGPAGRVGAALAGAFAVASVAVACTTPVAGAPLPPSPAPVQPPTPSPAPTPAASTSATPTATPTATPAATPALVVGDSIAIGSAEALRAALGPRTTVDGKVGRQFAAAPPIVEDWVRDHDGPVVVDLGANGTVEQDDVDEVVRLTATAPGGPRRLVLVGVEVDRRWEDPNNAVLRGAAETGAPDVVFVDWSALVGSRPGLLGPDGVHPGPQGRTVLADAVADALRR
ncbi:peptidoglycan-N-acetylmuramate O-acetyltransferase [Pseudonocardia sediminis]|uniref:Peptidoglycan-N-acetylmuramate O-acetyltransferase n=1 Tax=Pseudonocardia sediminis TaxID=1397368 RepID=A0A4Q7UV61_PSEST|nr:acyltransferase family protein [Pseudonocardia sediminis]RZT85857.1 peptidoglycan-N-acetylmuramate O-acetyltransferase [Pseudonocardia sediminis]